MARRGKDNDQTKSGQLRQWGQYRIQYVMMTKQFVKASTQITSFHNIQ